MYSRSAPVEPFIVHGFPCELPCSFGERIVVIEEVPLSRNSNVSEDRFDRAGRYVRLFEED